MTPLTATAAYARRRPSPWSIGTEAIVVAVGVLGVMHGSWLTRVMPPPVYGHALFGLLLVGSVIVDFAAARRRSPPRRAAEIRAFSRRQSRTVFLVLYLVIGAVVVLNLGHRLGQGGTTQALSTPMTDCRTVILYGLVALALIRVLAYWSWRRLPAE